jgi:hypothetical protein
MNKEIPFGHLRVGALFTTGPADSLFIKLDDDSELSNCEGGHALFLEDGKRIWVPAMRLTNTPTKKNFNELAEKYNWEIICNRNYQLAEQYREEVEA